MLINEFIQFEKENGLFELEIQNIKFWHLIRFEIYNELVNQKQSIGIAHTNLSKFNLFQRLLLIFKQVPNYLFNNPLTLNSKSDILVFNHHRRVKSGKYFECLYTDEILKNVNRSHLSIEEPFLDSHYKPIVNTNIRYTDFINLLVKIKKRIAFKNAFSKKEAELVNNLLIRIENKFKVKFERNKWIKKVFNPILTHKLMYPYIEKIIDKVNPKIIFEVVSYGSSRFIINDIAKKKGIPTIELQHGTMGKYHIAYNFAEKMKLDTFPEYVFVFGEYWKNSTRLPIEESKVKIVGWPYYEQKLNQYKSKNKDSENQVILFISQGTIGKELSKIALELSRKIDLNQYKIIYKLHPGEYTRWKKEYPWLVDSDIQIIDNNLYDMHYYFSQSDVQVGVYSTALFEGLGYGLKTFIYKLYGCEFMEELYNNNAAELMSTADELLIKLNGEEDIQGNYDTSYFWEPNSMSKIIDEIDSIIDN